MSSDVYIYIYIHISPNKDLIVSRNGRSKKKTKKTLGRYMHIPGEKAYLLNNRLH